MSKKSITAKELFQHLLASAWKSLNLSKTELGLDCLFRFRWLAMR